MPHGTRKHRANKRLVKHLGHVAQAAISHNDEITTAYVESMQTGVDAGLVGGVARADPHSKHPGTIRFGDTLFSVQLNDGRFIRATTRGMLRLRGKVFRNPAVSTVIDGETPVVLIDMGYRVGAATHLIVGVMTLAQADEARPFLVRALTPGSNSNSYFASRSSSTRRRNAAARAITIAELARTRTAAQRAEHLRIAATATAGGMGPVIPF